MLWCVFGLWQIFVFTVFIVFLQFAIEKVEEEEEEEEEVVKTNSCPLQEVQNGSARSGTTLPMLYFVHHD